MDDVLGYEGTKVLVPGAASGMGAATAASLAALNNHGGGLRFLVGACGVGANAVGDTRTGRTPLHAACIQGDPDAVTGMGAVVD